MNIINIEIKYIKEYFLIILNFFCLLINCFALVSIRANLTISSFYFEQNAEKLTIYLSVMESFAIRFLLSFHFIPSSPSLLLKCK